MRLNEVKPAAGSKHAKKRVGRGIGCGTARPRDAATRARNRAPAAFTRSASKAARCRCSGACPSAASFRHLRNDTAEVRLSDLQKLAADVIDLAVLKSGGRGAARARCAPR